MIFDEHLETLLELSFVEDLNFDRNDATSELLFAKHYSDFQANIVSKHPEPIVLCGLPLIERIYRKLEPESSIHSDYKDGDSIEPGKKILTVKASAQTILMGERLALNFLRHLCAIATLTSKFVYLIAHTNCKVLDTRKTTPGMRSLEKYAVKCGGGVNHRMGLFDAIMIKDTHADLLGGLNKALEKVAANCNLPVIVEVRNIQELNIVLQQGLDKVNRVLLDNMSLDELSSAVQLCKNKISTEASGNINLSTIKAIAETGVDFASVGMLTHSAGQVDLSMKSISNTHEYADIITTG